MKKYLLWAIGIFFLLALAGCKTSAPAAEEAEEVAFPAVVEIEPRIPQPPQIDVASMKIENINPNRAQILVTINVENTNVFEIPSPTITYDYRLDRNSFIKGIIESETLLAASSITPVEFRLLVFYTDLYRSNRQLRTSGIHEIPSSLVMTCNFDIPVIDLQPMFFELTGTLPLLR